MKTVHLVISGKVQGVFFRESARKLAEELSIKGWIKNTDDEKVEALISGDENDVNDFISWCHMGPERAEVTDVIVSQVPATSFEKFKVIRNH
jgi:acylphosphatase